MKSHQKKKLTVEVLVAKNLNPKVKFVFLMKANGDGVV
jgi:hypothetical protein